MNSTSFTVCSIIILLALYSFKSKKENPETNALKFKAMTKETISPEKGTVMLIVRGTTVLTEDELLEIAKERAPQFEAIPGLIQKYYIKTKNPGEYGGVYIWDNMESVKKYKESELAATIGKAYKLTGPPSVEIIDIMFPLRE